MLKKYYLWIVLALVVLGLVGILIFILWPEEQPAITYEPLKPKNVITGPPETPLKKPIAMEVGLRGELYVVDSGNQRIVVFGEDGRFIMSFGSPGSGRAELVKPQGVAVAPNGQVYVADPGKGAVVVFAGDGSYLYTIEDSDKASFQPLSVKADSKGDIYIFDNVTGNFRVYDDQGKRKADYPAESTKGLKEIRAIDIDPEKGIVYGIGAGQSKYLKMQHSSVIKQGDKSLVEPMGIVYNQSYNLVLISEASSHKVLVFRDGGTYLGEFGGYGNGMAEFSRPTGLAFDEQGKLYVADTDNNRIVIYAY